MKRVSYSILPGENTDGSITFSIFELPKENIEKMEKVLKSNNQRPNQYEYDTRKRNKNRDYGKK